MGTRLICPAYPGLSTLSVPIYNIPQSPCKYLIINNLKKGLIIANLCVIASLRLGFLNGLLYLNWEGYSNCRISAICRKYLSGIPPSSSLTIVSGALSSSGSTPPAVLVNIGYYLIKKLLLFRGTNILNLQKVV